MVPLLEDDASVTLVLSQAVRALAWGTIPPANGRAMIAGCRAATEVLKLRLAVAQLEAKLAEHAEPQVTDVVEDRGDLYSRQMPVEAITRAWLEERAERQRVGELAGRQVSELAGQRVSELAGQRVSELAGQRVGELAPTLSPRKARGDKDGAPVDVASEGFVESHISENRGDVGHPGDVDETEETEMVVEAMVAGAAPTLSPRKARGDQDGAPASGPRDQGPGPSRREPGTRDTRNPMSGEDRADVWPPVTALWRAIEADVVGEPEVEADAEWEPVMRVEHPPQFRDLKDRWERAARRFGESLADLKMPRQGEDREAWRAALARPWDGEYPG